MSSPAFSYILEASILLPACPAVLTVHVTRVNIFFNSKHTANTNTNSNINIQLCCRHSLLQPAWAPWALFVQMLSLY